ncbi:MAG: hypothetical protein DRN99_07955 [Thermoproteota archaeon]|nr:MAG: hypothetical protein DRN99_07955 [Candidatus Korarchaeota archaeon]
MVSTPVKVIIEAQAEEEVNGTIEDVLPAGFRVLAAPSEVEVQGEKVKAKVELKPGEAYRLEYIAEPIAIGDYIAPGATLTAKGKPIAVSNSCGISVSDKPIVVRRELSAERLREADELEIKVMVAYLGLPGSPVVNMLFITVGLPPGFEVIPESLSQAIDATPQLERYEVHSPTRVDFLTGSIKPGTVFEFVIKARAKYPLKATVPPAKAQDYYNPDLSYMTAPTTVEVSG